MVYIYIYIYMCVCEIDLFIKICVYFENNLSIDICACVSGVKNVEYHLIFHYM